MQGFICGSLMIIGISTSYDGRRRRDECYVCEEQSSTECCVEYCVPERPKRMVGCPEKPKRDCRVVDEETCYALRNVGLLLRNIHGTMTTYTRNGIEKLLGSIVTGVQGAADKHSAEIRAATAVLEKDVLRFVEERNLMLLHGVEKAVQDGYRRVFESTEVAGKAAKIEYVQIVDKLQGLLLTPVQLAAYIVDRNGGLQNDLLNITDGLLSSVEAATAKSERGTMAKVAQLFAAEKMALANGLQKLFKEYLKVIKGFVGVFSNQLKSIVDAARAKIECELYEFVVAGLQRDGIAIINTIRRLVEVLTGCRQREVIAPFLLLGNPARPGRLY